jgi:mono/diheme cytochrome c family protein
LVVAVSGYAFAQEALQPLSFTPAQVAGGRANFAEKCAKCHGSDLEGGAGPALVGGVLDGYFAGSVGDLAEFIKSSMPQDTPGTLSSDETVTVVAFLASKNGRKPGDAPLPSDAAAQARIGFGQ